MAEKVTLTARQRAAIEQLLLTGDVSAAATAAHVSRETLYRWMKKDAFTAALHDAEADKLDALQRALVSLGERAAQVLRGAMDGDAPVNAQVRAADIALGHLLKVRELVTLEERVRKLEEGMTGERNAS